MKGELGIIADKAPCLIAIMANAKAWPLEAKANAQLMAAAPELLAELKLAVGIMYEPHASRMEALIAKAEGRTGAE